MSLNSQDTIGALCTAPGGALSVIRLSGPDSLDIIKRVWFGNFDKISKNLRTLVFGHALAPDGETCLAVYMPAPASYTGEDVCELQFHGGRLSARHLLEAVLAAGARHADPGEFTRRAFINGKLDLTQAEAVCDLVTAKTDKAFKLAEKQLSGRLGNRIKDIRSIFVRLLSEFESRLDFPEEELDWLDSKSIISDLEHAGKSLEKLLASASYGVLCRDGVKMAIAGAPNAGKSSLLNALLGFERAIVTDIPGTTRDTLEESLSIRGIPVSVTDTAGLRENTTDTVEKIGIERSRGAIAASSIVLWLSDSTNNDDDEVKRMISEIPEYAKIIFCRSKSDISPSPAPRPATLSSDIPYITISALTGVGIDILADAISEAVTSNISESETDTETVIEVRHESHIATALAMTERAILEVELESWELAASAVRGAIFELGMITGETAAPDILDEIFSRFCIGK